MKVSVCYIKFEAVLHLPAEPVWNFCAEPWSPQKKPLARRWGPSCCDVKLLPVSDVRRRLWATTLVFYIISLSNFVMSTLETEVMDLDAQD